MSVVTSDCEENARGTKEDEERLFNSVVRRNQNRVGIDRWSYTTRKQVGNEGVQGVSAHEQIKSMWLMFFILAVRGRWRRSGRKGCR
jgi:hypothetical protein